MSPETDLKAYADRVEARLEELLPEADGDPKPLREAMRYAALGPGKRLRPALCMAACAAVGAEPELAIDAGCALEMVHAFSLVHDDLPALDDDDLRRGRPTCHKVFGEAIAILAGDALFNEAYLVLAKMSQSAEVRIRAVQILAEAVGTDGVVAGEAADILAEGQPADGPLVEFIHRRKTAALIAASTELGALCGGGEAAQVAALRTYGECVGLAFQIADDLLNETATPEQLGKSAGSDRARGKATYPAVFGVEASRARAEALVGEARAALRGLPGDVALMDGLARYAIDRMR